MYKHQVTGITVEQFTYLQELNQLGDEELAHMIIQQLVQ